MSVTKLIKNKMKIVNFMKIVIYGNEPLPQSEFVGVWNSPETDVAAINYVMPELLFKKRLSGRKEKAIVLTESMRAANSSNVIVISKDRIPKDRTHRDNWRVNYESETIEVLVK